MLSGEINHGRDNRQIINTTRPTLLWLPGNAKKWSNSLRGSNFYLSEKIPAAGGCDNVGGGILHNILCFK